MSDTETVEESRSLILRSIWGIWLQPPSCFLKCGKGCSRWHGRLSRFGWAFWYATLDLDGACLMPKWLRLPVSLSNTWAMSRMERHPPRWQKSIQINCDQVSNFLFRTRMAIIRPGRKIGLPAMRPLAILLSSKSGFGVEDDK